MIYSYKIIASIIIGIIEGITEFLPISSTSHMIIAAHWLGIENKNTKILEIFIQLGSGLAILYFFYHKIIKILTFKNRMIKKKKYILNIIYAIIPTIFIGLIFYKKIKVLFNLNHIAYGLILGGLFLIFAERFKPKNCHIFNINRITYVQSIIIGLLQILSLYPGFSRSGLTIGTGIILGIQRSVAIEFSFIISIPLLIGASFFEFIKHFNDVKISEIPVLLLGFIISFVVSASTIKKLLKIMNKTSLIFFGIYRFIIAIFIYYIN